VVNRMRLAALDEYCALSGRSKEGLIAELEARAQAHVAMKAYPTISAMRVT